MLYFEAPKHSVLKSQPMIPGQTLRLAECGLDINCEIVTYQGEVNDLFKTSYLKYEIIGTDIQITSWQSGDRLRPAGRGCTKSLKALFLEKKIPVFRRGSIPVLRDENGILLVHGIALDQRAVPTPGEKALKINFLNTDTGEN
jgi:tRNA(Ile)-lysidine synthase